MNWSDGVRRLLRWPAFAAGGMTTALLGTSGAAMPGEGLEAAREPNRDPVLLPNTLNATADDRYAAHRSHGSHSSHGSHRSHRSSSGSRSAPAVPTPQTGPSVVRPSDPAPSTTTRTPSRTDRTIPQPTPQEVSTMVIRVQAALMRLGLYYGDIDGLLGPKTRAALRAFQRSQGIVQTGRMDIQTLTRLGISIP